MRLETRTKEVTIEGEKYRVREPSAAEFALYLQTRIDAAKPLTITDTALDSAETATRVLIGRCVIDPKLTPEQAAELAANSVSGLGLMAAIMSLGSATRGPPEKESDAG